MKGTCGGRTIQCDIGSLYREQRFDDGRHAVCGIRCKHTLSTGEHCAWMTMMVCGSIVWKSNPGIVRRQRRFNFEFFFIC